MKEMVYNVAKEKVGEVDLSEAVFSANPNVSLLYEVIKMQLACRRQGNASTRNRSEVSGTTAKMYRQKGTGRARHGDARANIFVGGGKSFGPHPRDWSYKIPKKMRRGGVSAALSLKKNEGKLVVVDNIKLSGIKTKVAVDMLGKLGIRNGLIVVDGRDENLNLKKSVSNIPGIKLVQWEGLNVYDIMNHEHTVMTLAAVNRVQEALRT